MCPDLSSPAPRAVLPQRFPAVERVNVEATSEPDANHATLLEETLDTPESKTGTIG
jgi:hypothetical protein